MRRSFATPQRSGTRKDERALKVRVRRAKGPQEASFLGTPVLRPFAPGSPAFPLFTLKVLGDGNHWGAVEARFARYPHRPTAGCACCWLGWRWLARLSTAAVGGAPSPTALVR